MFRSAILTLFLLTLVPHLSAKDDAAIDVLELTPEGFDAAVLRHPFLLLQFYAPWCGHSHQLTPEFTKAAEKLRGRATLARVDATLHVSLAEEFDVGGYPSIFLIRGGESLAYSGAYRSEGLVAFVEEHGGVVLHRPRTTDELEQALLQRGARPAFVAKGDATLDEYFKLFAEKHQALGHFLYLEQPESAVVQIHRGIDEVVELPITQPADQSNIEAFLQREMLPAFGEITDGNLDGYMQRATEGMLWACFHPDHWRSDAAAHMDVFTEVARTFKQFPAVYLDTKTYERHAREELGCGDFPAIALQLGNLSDARIEPRRYLTTERSGAVLSASFLTSWINSVLAGEVKEYEDAEDLDAEERVGDEREGEPDQSVPAVVGSSPSAGAEEIQTSVMSAISGGANTGIDVGVGVGGGGVQGAG